MLTTPATEADHRHSIRRPIPRRRPALDGLRALALVLLLVFDATGTSPPGGIFSFDIAFVLSGYLIASLLITEYRAWGSISVVSFYLRRARRLLPALLLTVVGTFAVSELVLDRSARAALRPDALASVLGYGNWRFVSTGMSPFAPDGNASPYRQLWPLSIEAQFYLLMPVLMIALIVITRANWLRISQILVLLAVLSAGWMGWLQHAGSGLSRVYYGTDTRAQSLLLGSALAVYLTDAPRDRLTASYRRMTTTGIVAVVVMAALVLSIGVRSDIIWYGGFFVFALATLAVIAIVELDPVGPVAAIFGYRPFAWIGKISYGIYLWHWPIFLVLTQDRVGFGGPGLFAVRVLLSLAAGAASHYLVENPIRLRALRA